MFFKTVSTCPSQAFMLPLKGVLTNGPQLSPGASDEFVSVRLGGRNERRFRTEGGSAGGRASSASSIDPLSGRALARRLTSSSEFSNMCWIVVRVFLTNWGLVIFCSISAKWRSVLRSIIE